MVLMRELCEVEPPGNEREGEGQQHAELQKKDKDKRKSKAIRHHVTLNFDFESIIYR